VPSPFSRKRRTQVTRTAPKNGAKQASTRVSLKPGTDWHKRNFLTEVLVPSLFTKRSGIRAQPLFPKVRPGEICITWIGHASFLIQMEETNVLIDPNWSMWLSVIKRLKRPGLNIDHLPSIDFVLVTHAHFDHLNRRSLRRVASGQPIVAWTARTRTGTDIQAAVWNPISKAWTALGSSLSAGGISQTGKATNAQVLVIGGKATITADRVAGSWLLEGASFIPYDQPVIFPARMNVGVAYDPERERVVVYGGNSDDCPRGCAETWELTPE